MKNGLNKFLGIIILLASCHIVLAQSVKHAPLKLWYKHPAESWMQQALPIGNGRMGAMVFGGIQEEHVQFNEKSVWSGRVNKNENIDLVQAMPAIQNLLASGEVPQADSILKNAGYLKYNGAAPRENFGAYQPFGDIKIRFRKQEGLVKNYSRELDISKGTAGVNYSVNGVDYRRTFFCSYPDQLVVIHLTASKPGGLFVELEGLMPHAKQGKVYQENQDILFDGKMPESGLFYQARLRVVTDGKKSVANGKNIWVDNASYITVLLSANTNYQLKWPGVLDGEDPAAVCLQQLRKVDKKPYIQLLQQHIADHAKIFSAVSFDLGRTTSLQQLPTDERLSLYAKGNQQGKGNGGDPGLEALLFQYGRYLLIASSRGNTLPANLQGIWNDSPTPAWDSDYHTDINLQMNYWLAGPANLGSCMAPLVKYINFLRGPGHITAREYFGSTGFFIQMYTNPWGYASPRWLWTGAAGWLCQNLYDHFLFSGDYSYLKLEAYPIMKDACRFYLDIVSPYKNGKLAVVPSNSPEINFTYTDGKDYRYSAGAAIDQQIVYDLFTNTMEAAAVLGIDQPFADSLSVIITKLSDPVKIAKDGTVQEWIQPWQALDTAHRHLSQLYALFPGRLINPATNPRWAKAAAKTILKRGYGFTEWATTWRMLFWARLKHAAPAYDLFKFFINRSTNEQMDYFNTPGSAGVYDNLLAAHSPFQVDGNMGFTAAIAEMLLQSHVGNWKEGFEIDLLPALPDDWKEGRVSGLKARGNIMVGMQWENGKITKIKLESPLSKQVLVKYGTIAKRFQLRKGEPLELDCELKIFHKIIKQTTVEIAAKKKVLM